VESFATLAAEFTESFIHRFHGLHRWDLPLQTVTGSTGSAVKARV